MIRGTVYREKRKRAYGTRYAGVVIDQGRVLRIQTVQRVFGVWVRQSWGRVCCITRAEFAQRFEAIA